MEKSALASTTDLKASVNAGPGGGGGQASTITNAQGQIVPLNTNANKTPITFDADFGSANLD